MDIAKLRYFTTAAECGSFSETARRLYTSQPNISKQILSLEKELGVRLFYRDRNTLRLTGAGEYLYEQMKDMPAQFDRIFETARALGRGDRGAITVGVLAGQRLDRRIIEKFKRFTERYAEIGYTLEQAGFSDLHAAISSFRFDIIITLSFDVTPSPDIRMVQIQDRQQPALFVSRMSPLAQLEDFSGAPFIAISPKESFGGYEQLLNFCRKKGFEPNVVRLADSLDSLLFYVEAGVGVALLDRNTRLETDQNIRVIPMEDDESPVVMAVWSARNTNPNIRKMVDILKED